MAGYQRALGAFVALGQLAEAARTAEGLAGALHGSSGGEIAPLVVIARELRERTGRPPTPVEAESHEMLVGAVEATLDAAGQGALLDSLGDPVVALARIAEAPDLTAHLGSLVAHAPTPPG